METSRYQKGINKIMEFTDPNSQTNAAQLKIEENLRDIAPDVSRFMIEFAYGEVYTRSGLDNKQRMLITISSLVTQGMFPQLEIHINGSLTAGLTPDEIIETFIHLLPYVGFPRVLNAVDVAKKVFAQRGVAVTAATAD